MNKMEKLGEQLQNNIWKGKRARQKQEGRKTMSVMEMGKILGLKKTESYWLANKHNFKLIQIRGHTRVDIESFEKWYANQVKYRKVDGEPPGKELIRTSYSPQDISKMLGICEQGVYDLIRRKGLPVITVDYWMRVPKEAFDYWYEHQVHYRNQKDRERDATFEAATLTMPEMARLLGVHRNTVYAILKNPKNEGLLKTVTIAGKKRITKESFNLWHKECLKQQKTEIANISSEPSPVRKSANDKYYTLDEISKICEVHKTTLSKWIKKGYFPVKKYGHFIYVPKAEFNAWFSQHKKAPERSK